MFRSVLWALLRSTVKEISEFNEVSDIFPKFINFLNFTTISSIKVPLHFVVKMV